MRMGIAATLSLILLTQCVPRKGSDGSELRASPDFSRLKTEGLATIGWPCAGTGTEFPPGLNSQEEYCEWTRTPESYTGTAVKIEGGAPSVINVPKACIFNNSFDQSRKYFLTRHTVGTRVTSANPFKETYANSYAFLVGGKEPDSPSVKTGIIGHCISGNSCTAPNCVPNRASDPQICRALNQLGDRKCQVDVGFEVAPVITATTVPPNRHGDRVVKPQLLVRNTIFDNCWYAEDPAIKSGLTNSKGQLFNAAEQRTLVVCDAKALNINNCDQIANDITVVATLKLKSRECVGGAPGPNNPTPTPTPVPDPIPTPAGPGLVDRVFCKIAATTPAFDAPKSDANKRFDLTAGTEIFVRGFVGSFVSATVTVDGREFGAGAGSPTFVARSSIDAASCVRR